MNLQIPEQIRVALAGGLPVVALESTVISHGLPYPHNLDLARAMEGEGGADLAGLTLAVRQLRALAS